MDIDIGVVVVVGIYSTAFLVLLLRRMRSPASSVGVDQRDGDVLDSGGVARLSR